MTIHDDKPGSCHEYRRRLPHWRLDDAVYFVTWRIARRQPIMSPDERSIVLNALLHFEGDRYDIAGCVVMDDHVHVLLRVHEGLTLEAITQMWKSFTSRNILKSRRAKAPFWQDESFDRIVRDAREFDEKLSYIWNNPLKRWPDMKSEYPWVWWPGKEDIPANR